MSPKPLQARPAPPHRAPGGRPHTQGTAVSTAPLPGTARRQAPGPPGRGRSDHGSTRPAVSPTGREVAALPPSPLGAGGLPHIRESSSYPAGWASTCLHSGPDISVSASQHVTPPDAVLQEARRLEDAVSISPPASSKTSLKAPPETSRPPAPRRSNLEGGQGTQWLPTSPLTLTLQN